MGAYLEDMLQSDKETRSPNVHDGLGKLHVVHTPVQVLPLVRHWDLTPKCQMTGRGASRRKERTPRCLEPCEIAILREGLSLMPGKTCRPAVRLYLSRAPARDLLEGEGGYGHHSRAATQRSGRTVKVVGGGYRRLEMRLGLGLG